MHHERSPGHTHLEKREVFMKGSILIYKNSRKSNSTYIDALRCDLSWAEFDESDKAGLSPCKKKKQPNSCAYRCWNCYGQRCQHYWCKDENDVLAPFQKALRDRGIHRIRGNCLYGTGRFLVSVFRILSSIFAYGFRWEANHICYPYFHSVHFLIRSCSSLKSTETGLFVLRRISLAARST